MSDARGAFQDHGDGIASLDTAHGLQPTTETERRKYERVWSEIPDYRVNSPGEQMLMPWLKIVKPKPHATIIDFGCGCGRAPMVMGLMGFRVTMVDIADNCLDPDVRELVDRGQMTFHSFDFSAPLPGKEFRDWGNLAADHGYCCDVMEHIPPERVDDTIANILACVSDAFFLVNFHEDHFGADIGDTLHLTVRPFSWWRDKFREHGTLIEARDLVGKGIFRVTP